MDNRSIDVTSEGRDGFAKAMEIIWPSAAGGNATDYLVCNFKTVTEYWNMKDKPTNSHTTKLVEDKDGVPTLVLCWHSDRGTQPLPYPMTINGAIEFAWGWLQQVSRGSEPDHDGSNGKGWRLFTEAWGHVAGRSYAIVAIQPAWAMYGK